VHSRMVGFLVGCDQDVCKLGELRVSDAVHILDSRLFHTHTLRACFTVPSVLMAY
jgi:hypothetical protein